MFSEGIIEEFIKTIEQFLDNEIEISILQQTGTVLYTTNRQRLSFDCIIEKIVGMEEKKQRIFKVGKQDAIIAGIFMEGKPFFYIVLIGNIKEIKPIAIVLQMALEIRIKYDKEQDKNREERSLNAQIMKELFQENPRKGILRELLNQGNYNQNLPRILLLLDTKNLENKDMFENTNFHFDSRQDIVTIYKNHIIILKDCSKQHENYNNKQYIQSYIRHIRENTVMEGKIYVSELCNELGIMKEMYEHVCWLKEYLDQQIDKLTTRNFFFRDYFDIYMMSKIPMNVYDQVYARYVNSEEFDQESFLEIIRVVMRNNYNYTQSSKDLYMHRNTFLYKMEKIKRILHVDPLYKEEDRFFLKGLCYYVMTKKSREG